MKFRKKPVVIEAEEFESSGDILARARALQLWAACMEPPRLITVHHGDSGVVYLTVVTFEGLMRADVGDWIVRGVQGEIYPVKPDIFAATYELAGGPTP